jgi:hypothetical protein
MSSCGALRRKKRMKAADKDALFPFDAVAPQHAVTETPRASFAGPE